MGCRSLHMQLLSEGCMQLQDQQPTQIPGCHKQEQLQSGMLAVPQPQVPVSGPQCTAGLVLWSARLPHGGCKPLQHGCRRTCLQGGRRGGPAGATPAPPAPPRGCPGCPASSGHACTRPSHLHVQWLPDVGWGTTSVLACPTTAVHTARQLCRVSDLLHLAARVCSQQQACAYLQTTGGGGRASSGSA